MATPLFPWVEGAHAMDHRFFLSHDYALINPVQVEASAYAHWQVLPVVPKALSDKPHLLPCLLNLRSMEPRERIDALALAQDWQEVNPGRVFFSALLASPAEGGRIAKHLSAQLLMNSPDGSQALFRWYDPSVFRHLPWLLDDVQLNDLMGPIDAWSWQAPPGQWHRHERSGPARRTWLRLDEAQWVGLTRVGVMNRALSQLARRLPGRDIPPQEVLRLLALAYEVWGLEYEPDCLLFVEQALRFGDGIHQHPELGSRLRAAAAGGLSYVGACAGLDLNQWQRAGESDAARAPQGDQEKGGGLRSL
ncbi:DUF4123 domain-containing protein [Achromobacter sp. RTa]|uniref:DUF4123 domain-containing protein n=1 Tax=Achromobacter sp. RTa TaxID=1532557 RepID=UPI0009DCCBB2|nr:DUF4123 domain-containing protein [Achromobacter sp. RTa]